MITNTFSVYAAENDDVIMTADDFPLSTNPVPWVAIYDTKGQMMGAQLAEINEHGLQVKFPRNQCRRISSAKAFYLDSMTCVPQKACLPISLKGAVICPDEIYQPGVLTGESFPYRGQMIPVYKGVETNPFSQNDFRWSPEYPDRLEYAGNSCCSEFGIDVSAFQNRASENQNIDWDAVARDGVSFVFVRIGFRGTSTGKIYEDAYYQQNIRGAKNAGLETGVYFFSQAVSVEEALEEADFVIACLKNEQINGPVVFDWEMRNSSCRVHNTSAEMATACAVAFCKRIENAGYQAMTYGGQYVNYLKYDQGAIDSYDRWYAEYKGDQSEFLYPTFYYRPDYWQFSSKCMVNGIGNRVDGNLRFTECGC